MYPWNSTELDTGLTGPPIIIGQCELNKLVKSNVVFLKLVYLEYKIL